MNSRTDEIINHLDSNTKKWFAIYTKYKCEKFVCTNLRSKQIDCYVPLLKSVKQYTRKIKTFEAPLINCYVFVYITKDQYVKVLETEYVMTFIKQRKHLISIPNHEIDLLKTIVGEFQENLSITDITYVNGQEVEIIGGSLTGLKGILLSQKNKNQFVIELKNIGIQLQIEINPGLIRPVHKRVRV